MMDGMDTAAMAAALESSPHCIVMVPAAPDQPGYANAAARRLLELSAPNPASDSLHTAIVELAKRCDPVPSLDPERLGHEVDEVWSLPPTGQHFRVSCSPVADANFTGHSWMFCDMTGEAQELSMFETEQAAWLATQRRYELAAEYTSDIVLTADNSQTITWVAPSVSRTLGWRPEEVIGQPLARFVHPDDRPAMALKAQQVFDVQPGDAVPVGSLVRCRTAAGGYQWMLGQSGPIFGTEGPQSGIIVGLRSVQELVESKQDSERSQELIRAAMDGLLTPLVLWGAVRDDSGAIVDFNVIDANRATTEYLGLSRQEFLESTIMTLLPGLEGTNLITAMVDCVELGQPLLIEGFFYHHDILGDDRWYDIEGSKVLDGVALSWHDITERQVNAARLAESESHYRELSRRTEELRAQLDALLTDGSVLALRFSAQGEVLWLSGSVARLLGMSPEEVVRAPAGRLVHADDGPTAAAVVARVLETGEPETVTARLRHADGGYRVFEGQIFLADERVLQATLTDVTEREEADQLRQLVVAVASHELRTPLAFLFATLSMIQDGTIDVTSSTGRDLVDRMVASAARLGRLADSLLRMQRLQYAGPGQEIEPLAVGNCVLEAARSVDWVRGISLVFHDETEGRQLLINADLLTQAVVNLVGNAVKFSPDDSHVEVTVTCTEDRVRVSVRDHGRGIPADQRPMVFDSFFQVRADDRLHGIGLGLPIVRRIAELHQGRVRVAEPDHGEGSVFDLELSERPLADM